MEIAIAIFLGAWVTFFSLLAYKTINKDYQDITPAESISKKENDHE